MEKFKPEAKRSSIENEKPFGIEIETDEDNRVGTIFRDYDGNECSIVESSLHDEEAIRLGVQIDTEGRNSRKMHLTREMAKALLPHLTRFVETGRLTEEDK